MMTLASAMMSFALAVMGQQDSASGAAGRPGSVVISATFDRSEWTPPGMVSLDLGTGRYELTPAPSRGQHRAGIAVQVRRDTLAAAQLERARAASELARSQGLIDPSCRAGKEPPTIILSNAGPIMMELTTASGTVTTPDQLGCWSRAARRLHDALEAVFGSQVYPTER